MQSTSSGGSASNSYQKCWNGERITNNCEFRIRKTSVNGARSKAASQNSTRAGSLNSNNKNSNASQQISYNITFNIGCG